MQSVKTILVCEDDAINRMLITAILRKTTHRVVEVESGQKCLEYLLADYDGVDIVLQDISLPGISGVQVCQAIRVVEKGSGRRLPVIAYTGYASDEERSEFVNSGFDDVLTKPITMRKLFDLLDKYLIQ